MACRAATTDEKTDFGQILYRQTTRAASSFDAAAENGPVKSVVYSYTNKDEDGNVTSGILSFTFAYCDASVATPDLTEWELIVIGERSKIEPSQIRVENIKIQTTSHIAFQEVSVLLFR